MTRDLIPSALTRRRFLLGGGAAVLALATGRGGRGANDEGDALPDGSAAKDAITPEAQRAIDRGLSYLANNQAADGSFGGRSHYQGNVAVASLAALALMAGGHQPGRGTYGNVVRRALLFVLSKESRSPAGFLHNPIGPPVGPMYSHGFGTLFLAEVYGMIPERELQQRVRGTLERAVQVIVNAQNPEGGWRYQPRPENADISVTICQIMALRAARNAGLAVPKKTVADCVKYVLACQMPDGGFSYFRQRGGGGSAFARSAAGVVALSCAGIYLGQKPEYDKVINSGLRYLQQFKPSQPLTRRDIPDMHYFYGQYYAAQAMWTAGGRYWAEWYPAVREELLLRQRGRADGAWTDSTTCDAYATAMACIILQIPNNYLPILQK